MSSIQALKIRSSIKKLTVSLFTIIAYSQSTYADTSLSVNTPGGEQTILIKNGKAYINHAKGTFLFNESTNTLTSIDHQDQSFTILNESSLKKIADKIGGVVNAITAQLSHLPEAQHKQLEAFMGGGTSKQEQNKYTFKPGKIRQHNGIECQASTVVENGASIGYICLTLTKPSLINDADYKTALSFQGFIIEAANIMQGALGKTTIDIPNFESVKTKGLIISSEMYNNTDSNISVTDISNKAIAGDFVVPQNYTQKDASDLANLAL